MIDRVTRQLAPGAILLLHEGPKVPPAIHVRAIAGVLERLGELGYRCVVPTPDQLTGGSAGTRFTFREIGH